MKTLALALMIPVVICTACSKTEESSVVSAPATVDAPVDAPVTEAAPVPARAEVSQAPAANAPATGVSPVPPPATARVSLTSAAGSAVKGDLTLSSEGVAVLIRGEITGLAPGKEHGFHVHEVGACALPDFASAGDHFNPTKDPHGGPKSKSRHLGDMPNAKADDSGRATIDFRVEGATLIDKDGGPNEILGKALVVHAMPDDYKTQPSGGSGARVACGVIL
jgi:Cu-Zn family superoxide dismutase